MGESVFFFFSFFFVLIVFFIPFFFELGGCFEGKRSICVLVREVECAELGFDLFRIVWVVGPV